jgi:hypothetical protein
VVEYEEMVDGCKPNAQARAITIPLLFDNLPVARLI